MQTILGYLTLILNLVSPSIILIGFVWIGLMLRGRPKSMLLILIAYCGLIAFMFVPTEYDDLYRYLYLINRFRGYGWAGMKTIYVDNYWYSTSLLFQGLMYVLSCLPEWCTAVLPSALTYTLIGLFDIRYFKLRKTTNRIQCLVILLQFISIDVYSTVSSWLYMLTFSILANILFTDLILKKRQLVCMAAYLVLGQLHTVAYIIFTFRILAILLPQKIKKASLLVVFLWHFLTDTIVNVASGFSGNPFGKRIYENIVSYSEYAENSNAIYMLGLALFAMVCIICIEKNELRRANSPKEMDYIIQCCCAFILGAWGSQNLMFRFAHFAMICMPVHIGEEMSYMGDRLSIRNISLPLFAELISVVLLLTFYIWISYRLLI